MTIVAALVMTWLTVFLPVIGLVVAGGNRAEERDERAETNPSVCRA